jgi:hypothetical protein
MAGTCTQAHEQLMTRKMSRGVNAYGDSMMRDAESPARRFGNGVPIVHSLNRNGRGLCRKGGDLQGRLNDATRCPVPKQVLLRRSGAADRKVDGFPPEAVHFLVKKHR